MKRQNIVNVKQKRRLIKFGLGTLFFCSFFVMATAVKADFAISVFGWLWGGTEQQDDGNPSNGNSGLETGVGWISMSSDTTKIICDTDSNGFLDVACGGNNVTTVFIPYGLIIPAGNADLSGSVWSSNLGWISFNRSDLSGCPSGDCGATRVGNAIYGWARIMGIAQESAIGNSAGWQGWIHLNDTASSKYGVIINSADGKFIGSAWSDEFGFINFGAESGLAYGAQIPMPPVISLSADPFQIDIDATPGWAADNGNQGTKITLSWINNGSSSCTKSWGNWTEPINNSIAVTNIIYQKEVSADYRISCEGPGGHSEQSVNVSTVCKYTECGNETCDATSIYGYSDPSVSECAKKCSDDLSCAPKKLENWKEIAP